jgi:protein-disulfide isomerase
MNVEKWVDERLSLLDTGSRPMPDANSVLDRLNSRQRDRRRRRNRLLAIGVPCLIGCAATATVISIRREPIPQLPVVLHMAAAPLAARGELPIEQPPKRPEPVSHLLIGNFKEIGSPSAPIGCEIYTDLECPPCAAFYRDTVPRLISEYVDTGKVRLVRRDFPLPQHRYARLAARYANAAGLVGKYDVAFNQLMATQSAWTQDGDLETPLAAVLSAEEIEKVRKLLNESPAPEESVLHDRAAGADDHVQQTPSIVIVADGKRYTISGVVTLSVIKSYLDDILARQ